MDTIQILVDEPAQLFSSIDPSPFRKRDLDPDCEEFILAWAREFPAQGLLRLEIHLGGALPDEAERQAIAGAVRAHFQREAELQQLKVSRILREGRLSLLIGAPLLVACTAGAALLRSADLGQLGVLLAESLIIAGWVAMWHPLEMLLYGTWPVFRERRLLRRLAAADVALQPCS
ncbi:MAG: hypothetical protein R3E86_04485 [Pseudomonadales bacterium]